MRPAKVVPVDPFRDRLLRLEEAARLARRSKHETPAVLLLADTSWKGRFATAGVRPSDANGIMVHHDSDGNTWLPVGGEECDNQDNREPLAVYARYLLNMHLTRAHLKPL